MYIVPLSKFRKRSESSWNPTGWRGHCGRACTVNRAFANGNQSAASQIVWAFVNQIAPADPALKKQQKDFAFSLKFIRQNWGRYFSAKFPSVLARDWQEDPLPVTRHLWHGRSPSQDALPTCGACGGTNPKFRCTALL